MNGQIKLVSRPIGNATDPRSEAGSADAAAAPIPTPMTRLGISMPPTSPPPTQSDVHVSAAQAARAMQEATRGIPGEQLALVVAKDGQPIGVLDTGAIEDAIENEGGQEVAAATARASEAARAEEGVRRAPWDFFDWPTRIKVTLSERITDTKNRPDSALVLVVPCR